MKKKISVGWTLLISLLSVLLSVLITLQCTYRFVLMDERRQHQEEMVKLSQKFEPKRNDDGSLTLPFKFQEVYDHLKKHYVGTFDEKALETELLKWLMQAIGDDYAAYFTKEEYADYTNSYSGTSVGIGLRISYSSDRRIFVLSAPKGTPAFEAGLSKGDEILKINRKNVQTLTSAEIKEEISGEAGSSVSIEFKKGDEIFEKSILRKNVYMPSVEYSMEEQKIGFIRIYSFQKNTPKEFREAVDTLEKAGCKGFVFDIRENRGGLLKSVHQMLDYLLDDQIGKEDRVVFKRKDARNNEERYICTDGHQVSLPMAVLMNKNTASAAEIFAFTLQDYEKATLIGEQTFGKGVSQSIIRMEDGTAIKLTTAYFYSPGGKNYHKVGVAPDIPVKDEGKNIFLLPLEEDPCYREAVNSILKAIK